MRLFASFLIIASPLLSIAQITIGPDDMPQENSVYTVSNGSLVNAFDFSETGANYNWDYSDLEGTNQATQTYVPVSGTPIGYQFLFNNPFDPEYVADYALSTEGFDVGGFSFEEFFAFYQNDDNAHTIVGYGATLSGIPVPSQTDPVDDVYLFPLEFGDTHAGYSEWEVELPGIGYYQLKQDRVYEVEGWGSISTPYDTFECIKVRTEIEAEDSVYVDLIGQGFTFDRTSVQYTWLALEEGVPVLTVTENLGQTTTIQYKDEEDIPDFVQDLPALQGVSVYPTLTRDIVNLKGADQSMELTIYAADGRRVASSPATNQVHLAEFGAGYYLVYLRKGEASMCTRVLVTP